MQQAYGTAETLLRSDGSHENQRHRSAVRALSIVMRRVSFGFAAFALILFIGHAVNATDGYRLLQLSGKYVKWGAPEFGTGVTLTYALVGAGEHYVGERNCRWTGEVEPLLQASELSRASFEAELVAAFNMWSAVANIRFQKAPSASVADILIGAQAMPRGQSYADISVADNSDDAIGKIERGLICLNPELRWSSDTEALSNGYLALRYTLAHEIGHLLALDHPSARGALMSFLYNGAMGVLQPGDIAGVIALYGPASGDLPLTRWRVASGTAGETHSVQDILPGQLAGDVSAITLGLSASRVSEGD